jgi:capsular polysaccharide biosynthesis protein
VNEPDQTATWAPMLASELRERLSYAGSLNPDEQASAQPSGPGLVSLSHIWASLRRSGRLLGVLALAGLVLGGGYYAATPPTYKATTSVLVVSNPMANPNSESATDTALANSLPVASAAVSQLGLQQSAGSFQGSYSAAAQTPQVLTISATGPSQAAATARASAVASQFLKFRARYQQAQQQQTDAVLAGQVSQAQQAVNAINARVSAASGGQLAALKQQQAQAVSNLNSVEQYAASTKASTGTLTGQMVRGSQVLNAAQPVKSSRVKGAALYAGGGLLSGLALGVAIVVIGAVTSDRLRRRDDIAYAIGAPVGVSVGRLSQRSGPALRTGAARRRRDMERVVEHLRKSVPPAAGKPAAMALIAVDDAPTAARAVVSLAGSAATSRRVVVADLSAGAHAARLLGVKGHGAAAVAHADGQVVVVVPAVGDTAPVGPFPPPGGMNGHARPDDAVTSACADADLVLSLVTLDPAFGADHVGTWATDAVALVTSGRSTATRIHAVGEMMKLAGTKVDSVVVIDADPGDESLGASAAAG